MKIPKRLEGTALDGLKDFVQALPSDIVVIEVGCFAGDVTSVLLTKARSLIAIDQWKTYGGAEGEESVFDRVSDSHSGKVVKVESNLAQVVPFILDESVDLVYIGGIHDSESMKATIVQCLPKLKKSGCVVGRGWVKDVCSKNSSDSPGIEEAVVSALGFPDIVFPDTTWVRGLNHRLVFDGDFYLRTHHDVATVITQGHFGGQCYQHYLQFGRFENRRIRCRWEPRNLAVAKTPDRIMVGIPLVNGLDLLRQCVDAIDLSVDLLVINNAFDSAVHEEIRQYLKDQGIDSVSPRHNLGVAASWNRIALEAFSRGLDYFVVGSNDCFLGPGALQRSLDVFKERKGGIVHIHSWNFFVVSLTTIQKVGLFDENFYPAYCEDQDYSYRCKLAGVERVDVGLTGTVHRGSQTILSDVRLRQCNGVSHAQNSAYYVSKWGGTAGEEKFVIPFNKPGKDLRWWPDPGDSVAKRDWAEMDVL